MLSYETEVSQIAPSLSCAATSEHDTGNIILQMCWCAIVFQSS